MEIPNKKQHEVLPYEKLALLGIDRDSADKLPQDIKQKLLGGEVTPLLNVSIKAHNGTTIVKFNREVRQILIEKCTVS
ncbi:MULTISPECIES: DUF4099 domain-containing protein [Bacteroidales]|uniref:DUF4099 domain-containing protein n=1 Tax=Bacteroidales TaxID=171549 RepID=UPI000F4A0AF5|nr:MULTISPECIES: DUF4099 domain-containing protein [Bacteroidales]ROT15330.1 DUF4099 domain-containing protein [Muribaculaceae bacterium Isolate-110 (HZI)]